MAHRAEAAEREVAVARKRLAAAGEAAARRISEAAAAVRTHNSSRV